MGVGVGFVMVSLCMRARNVTLIIYPLQLTPCSNRVRTLRGRRPCPQVVDEEVALRSYKFPDQQAKRWNWDAAAQLLSQCCLAHLCVYPTTDRCDNHQPHVAISIFFFEKSILQAQLPQFLSVQQLQEMVHTTYG